MKIPIAIIIAILIFMPTVYGTGTITDVRWNTNLKVIEILFDKFPTPWGGWKMYVDGKEWPMEGGSGNAIVRPNADVEKATGLFVGTDPWLQSLESIDFPCCGTMKFCMPGIGCTNEVDFNLAGVGCKTTSPKNCNAILLSEVRVIAPPAPETTSSEVRVIAPSAPETTSSEDRTPPAPDSGLILENNVDRPGMNYKSYALSSPDPQLCANDCVNDPDCKAFTYVKPGFRGANSQPECWLKNGVPNPVSQEYCISGVKTGATPEPSSVSPIDWSNIPGLALHLFHNVNQGDPHLEPTRTDLVFFGAYDAYASEGEGYCWWQVRYRDVHSKFSKTLPSGLVLGLKHLPYMLGNGDLVFELDPIGNAPWDDPTTPIYGFLLWQHGGDYCPADCSVSSWKQEYWGFYWFETYNPDFSNWEEAEKNLPKGTVLGLKHSLTQPAKTVIWRGQQYDPMRSYRDRIASPPTFTAKHGGDLGAPSGEGYYWYEKTTGPDFFQPRG